MAMLLRVLIHWPVYEPTPAGKALGELFARTCHQIPSRSFKAGDSSMPLCARCFGMSLGLAGAAALMMFFPTAGRRTFRIASMLLIVMIADWLTGIGGLIPDSFNLWRFIIGVLGGGGFYVIFATLVFRIWSLLAHSKKSLTC